MYLNDETKKRSLLDRIETKRFNREFDEWKRWVIATSAVDIDIFDLAELVQTCSGCPAAEKTCVGGVPCNIALRDYFAYAEAEEMEFTTTV